ncbi:hypothetical protein Sme01_35370 [Sphaerisporangium melleum]|uniref:Uncharacterized protein n=1 Tax=Sphaerisporangium melleum TaxID=321316 RepID=A0A917R9D8_9ACTN|nr:hypothetical protein [Sphaerisporangium melleum]GGK97024.1 hypothetical protein GCM10007964_44030 [Sphaerisporangium melleum]GII71061.1 hypothetical protein Sme01_35370 [Sphaerisporangium melleum]
MALLDARRRPGRGRLPFSRRPPTGRHRLGGRAAVPESPARGDGQVWDEKQQARAGQLGLLEPGWLVIYGVYSRRFYAIARMAEVAEPLIEATTCGELRALMRDSESRRLVPLPRTPEASTPRRGMRAGSRG